MSDYKTSVARYLFENAYSADHWRLLAFPVILDVTAKIIRECPDEITTSPVAMQELYTSIATEHIARFIDIMQTTFEDDNDQELFCADSIFQRMISSNLESLFIVFPEVTMIHCMLQAIERNAVRNGRASRGFWSIMWNIMFMIFRNHPFTHEDVIASIDCITSEHGKVHGEYIAELLTFVIQHETFLTYPVDRRESYYAVKDYVCHIEEVWIASGDVINMFA